VHDPLTHLGDLHWPWGGEVFAGKRYRPVVATLWHVDPERDGSDDSCGWAYPHLTPAERAWVRNLIYRPDDNLQSWFGGAQDHDERVWRLGRTIRLYKSLRRPWWRHPRWHVWHWRLTIYPVLNLKRWLWSRCMGCSQRFPFGSAPVSSGWDTPGPRWFRGETSLYHDACWRDTHQKPPARSASAELLEAGG